jgi:hypothetical protein
MRIGTFNRWSLELATQTCKSPTGEGGACRASSLGSSSVTLYSFVVLCEKGNQYRSDPRHHCEHECGHRQVAGLNGLAVWAGEDVAALEGAVVGG